MTNLKIAILLEMSSLDWHRAIESIRQEEESAGNQVSVFDLTDLAWPHYGSNGQSHLNNETLDGKEVLCSNVEIAQFTSSLKLSILRSDGKGLLANLVEKRLSKSARRILALLCGFRGQFDRVYVPNGRFPVARIAEFVFAPGAIKYFEIGNEGEARYFVADYPIHDRIARQSDFANSSLSEAKVREVSDSWLLPRTSSSSRTNAFSGLWDDSLTVAQYENVFFTSSTDEYWALGEQWHEDQWEDQYEAFDSILSCLEGVGEHGSVLRIHPNLLNKSVRYVKRELNRIRWIKARHPQLRVIYPQEPVNSYRLVDGAKRIIVSMSTIGLEASAAGKSVWATSANSYDLTADIRRVLRAEDVSPKAFEVWEVNDLRARLYLTQQLLEGVEYSEFLEKFKFPLWQTIPYRDLIFRVAFTFLKVSRKRFVLSEIERS